jgi:hypothetical protein
MLLYVFSGLLITPHMSSDDDGVRNMYFYDGLVGAKLERQIKQQQRSAHTRRTCKKKFPNKVIMLPM